MVRFKEHLVLLHIFAIIVNLCVASDVTSNEE